MSTTALRSRLDRIEARVREDQGDALHVICNMSDADAYGGFIAKHGRFKTEAEMDAEEAALFASGRALPGEEVHRLVVVIVDAQGRAVRK